MKRKKEKRKRGEEEIKGVKMELKEVR